MTFSEIEKISKHTFDELWNMLWLNKKIKQYQTEYDISKGKFENLKCGKYYLLSELISNSNISYVEREWGFPKGRRNLRESDYDCAIREFQEESGLKKDEYEILRNIRPVEEIFYGSNNIRYKHIYYIAESKLERELQIDPENKHQRTEIGNIGWYTLNEALQKIRPYNKEKKDVLIKVNKLLINNNC
jgi:8-oxo-dGTP pyrophosphatase MutT (NUDIX family)